MRRHRPTDRLAQRVRTSPNRSGRETPRTEPEPRGRQVGSAARKPRLGENTLDDPTNPEILLISSVIQTGDHTEANLAGITPEFFHSHRPIWEWLENFVIRYGKVPDKATFRSQYPDFPLLKTTDVAHAAESVEDNHLRYRQTQVAREWVSTLSGGDPHEALALVQGNLTELNRSASGRRADADVLRDFDDIFTEAQRRVESANSLGYAGLPFGFHTLNDRTGGLHPGDLAIWAARLGQGKTWFLCKVAAENLLRGEKVVFVSLEQSTAQIVFRIHTFLARALGYSLRHRDLMQGTNIDLDYYRSFLVDLPSKVPGQLVVADPTIGAVNPYTLASLMDRHNPQLMIVDYLTLMQAESDEWQGIAKLSKQTKQVAAQYGVPVLAAAQINREGDGGKRPPSAKNLAQSDAIGQDADVIVTMKKESESVSQLLLAKNRSGQDGMVFWSAFLPNEGRIEEIQHDEALTLMATDVMDED